MNGLTERLERSEGVRAVLGARAGDTESWLVGGTVRDAVLARPVDDVDVVVAGDAEPVARAIASRVDGFVFPLSERFGAWRVIARDRSWQSDVTPARGAIEEDLALRDFTVNAMAVRAADPGRLLDPLGGEPDLRARMLRAAGPACSRMTPCASCGWRASRGPRLPG